MKIRKNILKMWLHTFFFSICFIVCAVASFFYQEWEIFGILNFFLCMFILFNIRFIGVLILFILDVIFKNISSKDLKINAIDQNVDMASISFDTPTISDLIDKDSLVLLSIYVSDETRVERLRFYGNKSIFDEELKSIIDKKVSPRYKKIEKTKFILKKPGEHSYKVTYYNNSKIIKRIVKVSGKKDYISKKSV